MRCSACSAVYSNGLDTCPRCQTPLSALSRSPKGTVDGAEKPETDTIVNPPGTKAAPSTFSTLIEFPGPGRTPRPQWRKDLSERVREIQERRGRAESSESGVTPRVSTADASAKEAGTTQLGLVPSKDQPEMNPIVAAALKRIERAQQPVRTPRQRPPMGGAAVAVARVAEERYQVEQVTEPRPSSQQALEQPRETPQPTTTIETPREHALTVVPAQEADKAVADPDRRFAWRTETKPEFEPRIETQFEDAAYPDEVYDDRAPVMTRVIANLIDLMVVAFASSPFAAIIELTNGDWADERVLVAMGGIILLVMFLYLTTSTVLAGCTWGMSVVSLRAVDADTGLPPTTKQSVARAMGYIFSLATLGVGFVYGLVDAEGRTAHDHLSGTVVVRE